MAQPIIQIVGFTTVSVGLVSTAMLALTDLRRYKSVLIVLVNLDATANVVGSVERSQDGTIVDDTSDDRSVRATKQGRWLYADNCDRYYRLSAISDKAATSCKYGVWGVPRWDNG